MIKKDSKLISSIILAVIYLLALLVVWLIFPLFTFSQSMLNILFADIVATIVIFIFSVIYKNSSVYDPYWSLAPPFIVIYLLTVSPQGDHLRQLIITALVLLWSVRLTGNWLRGWHGFSHQDWRYSKIAGEMGKWYWPVRFLGIHLMPTIFVFLGCLPLWYALSSTAPFGIFDILATFIALTAIITEWIADEQLWLFRKNNPEKTFIRSGIWKYSRHPNYLGEISFWGGLFVFVLSSSGVSSFAGFWTIVGLISMIVLFNFISIPLMEKRNTSRKPGYAEYRKQVPALLPRFYMSKK